jgi:nucleotide-binding universal stress UspA family protein
VRDRLWINAIAVVNALNKRNYSMLKILVPIDGSENSLRAIEFLIKKSTLFRDPLELHLLNVQHPFPGTIRGVYRQAQKEHQEQGLAMLATARKRLDDAGLKYAHHIDVGEAPALIARYVEEKNIEQVVMGTRGHGTITGMLLGSVVTKVLHLVHVPVLLVPPPRPPSARTKANPRLRGQLSAP